MPAVPQTLAPPPLPPLKHNRSAGQSLITLLHRCARLASSFAALPAWQISRKLAAQAVQHCSYGGMYPRPPQLAFGERPGPGLLHRRLPQAHRRCGAAVWRAAAQTVFLRPNGEKQSATLPPCLRQGKGAVFVRGGTELVAALPSLSSVGLPSRATLTCPCCLAFVRHPQAPRRRLQPRPTRLPLHQGPASATPRRRRKRKR